MKASWLDMLRSEDAHNDEGVPLHGQANVFISHTWCCNFQAAVDTVVAFAEEFERKEEKKCYIWMDLFLLNQFCTQLWSQLAQGDFCKCHQAYWFDCYCYDAFWWSYVCEARVVPMGAMSFYSFLETSHCTLSQSGYPFPRDAAYRFLLCYIHGDGADWCNQGRESGSLRSER